MTSKDRAADLVELEDRAKAALSELRGTLREIRDANKDARKLLADIAKERRGFTEFFEDNVHGFIQKYVNRELEALNAQANDTMQDVETRIRRHFNTIELDVIAALNERVKGAGIIIEAQPGPAPKPTEKHITRKPNFTLPEM